MSAARASESEAAGNVSVSASTESYEELRDAMRRAAAGGPWRAGEAQSEFEAGATRTTFGDVVLSGRLRDSIGRLNPTIPVEARTSIRQYRIVRSSTRWRMCL